MKTTTELLKCTDSIYFFLCFFSVQQCLLNRLAKQVARVVMLLLHNQLVIGPLLRVLQDLSMKSSHR